MQTKKITRFLLINRYQSTCNDQSIEEGSVQLDFILFLQV